MSLPSAGRNCSLLRRIPQISQFWSPALPETSENKETVIYAVIKIREKEL